MANYIKNIIKIIIGVIVCIASAVILEILSKNVISDNGVFPPGVRASDWISTAIGNSVVPGLLWQTFWITLLCYIVWRLIWFVLYKLNPDKAPKIVKTAFFITIPLFLAILAVFTGKFIFDYGVLIWAITFFDFWVYFVPLAYIIPFTLSLIFLSKSEAMPFQLNKRNRGVQ